MTSEPVWTTKNGTEMLISTMNGKHIWHAERALERRSLLTLGTKEENDAEVKRCNDWIKVFRAERLRRRILEEASKP